MFLMRTRKIGQRKQLVSQIICGNDHLVEFSLTKRFIILRFTQVAEGCEVLLFMLPLLFLYFQSGNREQC